MQLVPGQSTLEDLYNVVGYPSWRRDFHTGVALRYASGDMKWNHVVVVDGVSGVVTLVAVVAMPRIQAGPAVTCVDVSKLKAEYGLPQLVMQNNGGWDYLLFENQGLGLMDDANSQIVQFLPPGTTMAEYQSHSGYGQESTAFTP